MDLFWYLIRTSRQTLVLAITAAAVSGLAGAGFVAMVNLVLTTGDGSPPRYLVTFILVCLCALVTRFVAQVLLFRLSQGAIYQLRLQLTESILTAPLSRLEKMGLPKVFSTLTDDVIVIASALPGLPLLCASVALVIGCVTYLAFLSPVVAIAALLFAVIGVAAYRTFVRSGMRVLRAARQEQDQLFAHFRAVTEGVKELKLNRHRRETFLRHQLTSSAAAFRDHSVVGLSIFEGASGGGQAVFFVLIGLLLFVLPQQFDLSAGVLASATLTVLFAVASLQSILVWLPMLGRASVALKKVEERRDSLRDAAEDMSPAGQSHQFDQWQRLELCDVTHVYPGPRGEEFVLGPLRLHLRRGEIVFVVGANGSGKTTLAKVLTGLYSPEQGTIRVDGVDIDDGNRESYRQLFSAIFSDYFLFDTLPGKPAPERAATAQHYLRRLDLAHKVSITDDRLSTIALSQGQRKRLALLAAYLEDRSCYLFDEWAADQDPVFKQLFYTQLLPELKARDKAVVVITHDDRYFQVADRIVRLDYGQIREEDCPDGQPVVITAAGKPGC